MIDPNAPAYPNHRPYLDGSIDGMTIRATMAMHMHAATLGAMGGIDYLKAIDVTAEKKGVTTSKLVAMLSVEHADALIAELNKTEVKP